MAGVDGEADCAFRSGASEDIKLPVNLDKLAARATESVDVTLDESMLQLASKFLSKEDPDEVQVKKLVGKLKGVYVRSFEFDKDGEVFPSRCRFDPSAAEDAPVVASSVLDR